MSTRHSLPAGALVHFNPLLSRENALLTTVLRMLIDSVNQLIDYCSDLAAQTDLKARL